MGALRAAIPVGQPGNEGGNRHRAHARHGIEPGGQRGELRVRRNGLGDQSDRAV